MNTRFFTSNYDRLRSAPVVLNQGVFFLGCVNALRESRVHGGLLFHWSNNAPSVLYPPFPAYHPDPKNAVVYPH